MTSTQAPAHQTNETLHAALAGLPPGTPVQKRSRILTRLREVANAGRCEQAFCWISSTAFLWRSPTDEQVLAKGWDGRPDLGPDDVTFTLLDDGGCELASWKGAPAIPLLGLGSLCWRGESEPDGSGPFDQPSGEEFLEEPAEPPRERPRRTSRWRRLLLVNARRLLAPAGPNRTRRREATTMLPIYNYLDLCTSHLPKHEADVVLHTPDTPYDQGDGLPRTIPHRHGAWVNVPADYERGDTSHRALDACLALAREHHCNWINFDSDGGIAEGLASYEW